MPAPTAQSDVAEQFVHDAVHDSAMLAVEFLDGTSLRGTPIAISTYALRLRYDDKSETCQIEPPVGPYSAFYLAGGVAAMLAQVAADPRSTVPNLGASGAIAAGNGCFFWSPTRAINLT